MKFQLREYQKEAINSIINHINNKNNYLLVEAATGAGKSIIIAELAKWINENSNGKKALCIAPSKELTEQNYQKYLSYGYPASIFSASIGKKSLKHNVVFGTPISVANEINKFGSQFDAVIIDEAHGITPTIKKIINSIKNKNKDLKIIGLTATPCRMNSGYIYKINEKNILEECATEPFFEKLSYKITAEKLTDMGYLTPLIFDKDTNESYETDNLILKSNGKFDHESIEKAFEGHGRKTAKIIKEVVKYSYNRKGVMIFSATVKHAYEVLASLPPEKSSIITGNTDRKQREKIIELFKNQKIKYLVNVSVLTTGFDAPHVDVIAVLRATESASLFQQIIGRGLRLYANKNNCLLLDYANNIERHELGKNIFKPMVKTKNKAKKEFKIKSLCKICGTINEFKGRPNKEKYNIDEEGYFLDLMGRRIKYDESDQYLPAHYGRQCNYYFDGNDGLKRCVNRWSYKECPSCLNKNDIAARYCEKCKKEIVDPNKKLVLKNKSYAYNKNDKLIAWKYEKWISKKGNETLKVDYITNNRTISIWYNPDKKSKYTYMIWRKFSQAVFGKGKIAVSVNHFIDAMRRKVGKMPESISYQKKGKYFEINQYNRTK